MVTLQETAVKFNNNLHASHTGGRLSSDSGLLLVDELMDAFHEEFHVNFQRFEVKKGNIIRYLLRKIHNHENEETRIIEDNNTVHVEHIMPKRIRAADDWKIDEDQHEINVNRFGNLTLLGQEYNRNAVNKDFESKKEIYLKSEISMTIDLIAYETWGVEAIEERQEILADVALEIW